MDEGWFTTPTPRKVSSVLLVLDDGSTIESDEGDLRIEYRLDPGTFGLGAAPRPTRWRLVIEPHRNDEGYFWYQLAPGTKRSDLNQVVQVSPC